ncbi:hypothetical protein ACJMK2_027992 [Sinanodonta woodiana]|uniref:Beta-taxilin n=2 Tax=Sinanodonta woodiana TaxID=1069815 RepID=A0ABD3X5P9_SINWO
MARCCPLFRGLCCKTNDEVAYEMVQLDNTAETGEELTMATEQPTVQTEQPGSQDPLPVSSGEITTQEHIQTPPEDLTRSTTCPTSASSINPLVGTTSQITAGDMDASVKDTSPGVFSNFSGEPDFGASATLASEVPQPSNVLDELEQLSDVYPSERKTSSASVCESLQELSNLVHEMEETESSLQFEGFNLKPTLPLPEVSSSTSNMEGGVDSDDLVDTSTAAEIEIIDNIIKANNDYVELSVGCGESEKGGLKENQLGEVTVSDIDLSGKLTLSTENQEEQDECDNCEGSVNASTELEEGNAVEQKEKTEVTSRNQESDQPKLWAATPSNKKIPVADLEKSEGSQVKSGKSKRKEDKSIEHILRALNSLQTTEEKLAALCKKYADLHEDHRVIQTSFKQTQRRLAVVTREKDQLQTEHTKAVMAKSKLESLCRELQKHNQLIRQESLQRAKEEDEKRKEISQKFQSTITEIQTQMTENHDKNKKLREENFELAQKLKKFIEQYETREKQVEKVMQHRELEQKLADAKLEQATAILNEEQARSKKEREVLIMQSTEYMKRCQLKEAELAMYKERYEEFQSTITRSEEMFQKFKTEMDKMTKRIKKLEKESIQWKNKWENANRALLEMAEEKTKYDKERPLFLVKISKLESLCRAMQAERQARKALEGAGLDPSALDMTPTLMSDRMPNGTQETNHAPNSSPEQDVADQESGEDSESSGESQKTGSTVIQKDAHLQSTTKENIDNREIGESPESPLPKEEENIRELVSKSSESEQQADTPADQSKETSEAGNQLEEEPGSQLKLSS